MEFADYISPSISDSNHIKLAIVGINDIHGHIIPDIVYTKPNGIKNFKAGGVTLFTSYLKALKKEWKDNIFMLDAGDQYQGTMESNTFFGEPVIKSNNYINDQIQIPVVSAIGNHEFDFGFTHMIDNFNAANYSYLSSNIYNKTTGSHIDFSHTLRHKMLSIAGLKIGIIGLSTKETVWTSSLNLTMLDFREYIEIVIDESHQLKALGANIILLVAHIGTVCKEKEDNINFLRTKLYNRMSTQSSNCNEDDELYKLVDQLPEGIVDGVVGGHRHNIMHHFVRETPVMMADNNARYFNILYITYDKTESKILRELSNIEGPIPICEKLFLQEKTCFLRNPKSSIDDSMELQTFSFHNQLIEEDKILLKLLDSYIESTESYKRDIIAYIEQPMTLSSMEESEIGNFVSDSCQRFTESDVTIINKGLIRQSKWNDGNFTNYDLYLNIPFDNFLVAFDLLGKNLIEVLEIVQQGSKAFYLTSGVILDLCEEPKKMLKVRLSNGEDIDPSKYYRLTTTNFLFYGGDDFRKVNFNIIHIKNFKSYKLVREIIYQELKMKRIINSKEKPIIGTMNPRMILHKKRECYTYDKKTEI